MNLIEKNLPKKMRDKMSTLIVTALGLFLALQYNDTISKIFEKIYPLDSQTILGQVIYILLLTVIIVYGIIMVEKALDGK